MNYLFVYFDHRPNDWIKLLKLCSVVRILELSFWWYFPQPIIPFEIIGNVETRLTTVDVKGITGYSRSRRCLQSKSTGVCIFRKIFFLELNEVISFKLNYLRRQHCNYCMAILSMKRKKKIWLWSKNRQRTVFCNFWKLNRAPKWV